jgi:hypothetical protein
MNVQLSDYNNFDVKNIIFSKADAGSVSGGGAGLSKISFKRMRMGCRYADGSTGDLLLKTPESLMSFGLQENTDLATGAVTGYQFPICLWNRNGATAEEKAFTDKFTEIAEYCKKYLVEHRDEIEKYDLELNDLKKFNPLYWKMEKGKIVEGRGPMLYLKVMSSKKTGQISTGIIDDETNTYIEPMDILNKRCYMTGAIKFESVFIGNKISLQIKLFETVVRIVDTNVSRGLLRPNARPKEEAAAITTRPTETFPSHESESAFESEDLPTSITPAAATTSVGEEYVEEIYEGEEGEEGDEGEEELQEEEQEEEDAPQAPPAPVVVPVVPTETVKGKTVAAKPTRGRPKAATATA